jgi:segregation and condensation protein B
MDAAREIPANLPAIVEALLFAADRPLSAGELADLVGRADEIVVPLFAIEEALAELADRLGACGAGVELAEVAGGWELRTRPALSPYVHVLYRRRPVRLSRAALEVLAIVAYRQPCTRADIDEIRGVDSSTSLRQLLERGLVRLLGKADDVGRPLIYGTGPKFLEFFGLRSLAELPTLREFTELTEEHLVRVQELDETLRANAGPQDADASSDYGDASVTAALPLPNREPDP